MRRTSAFSLFLACALCGLPAYSAEMLRFKSGNLPQGIADTLNEQVLDGGWEVSDIDLNDDGLKESILKTKREYCQSKDGCLYVIAAKKQGQWINLGVLNAFNILVSDRRTYGIRDLIVYSIPNNDFESVHYVWDPKAYQYEQE